MDQTKPILLGIDISKATFDLAYDAQGNGTRFMHRSLPNNSNGFDQLLKLLPTDRTVHIIMEASGPYYLKLATFLYEQGIKVSVVNPLVIRRFAQMRMIRAKTDKKDAQVIALYGAAEDPAPWTPESEAGSELRQMESLLELLQKQRTALKLHGDALEQSPHVSPDAAATVRKSLESLGEQIEDLTRKISDRAAAHYGDTLKLVKGIPGIGPRTAIVLLTVTGGLKRFSSAKQLSSYFGLCPRIFQSGTSIKGKGGIVKLGMSRIRAMLYLCSWSAIKCNRSCKELYERLLAKNKPKMVALIAVANKLLRQAFAVGSTGIPYKP